MDTDTREHIVSQMEQFIRDNESTTKEFFGGYAKVLKDYDHCNENTKLYERWWIEVMNGTGSAWRYEYVVTRREDNRYTQLFRKV